MDAVVAHAAPAVDDARSVRAQRDEQPLYVNRIKVYPRRVDGFYRRIKWAVLVACLAVYYLVPWLRWNRGPGAPDQAVLIDLPGRRAYFFAIEIWPQEVYYLTGLLILGAIGLFLVSSYLGRVWCGYTCPQTVWTDLFMWVERVVEGDRNARMKLDAAPWSGAKAAKKILKHASWLAIAVATGGAWVFYFADAPTTLLALATGAAAPTLYGFVALFTATTYVLAGWAREQVCTYMCPWPRFQGAMLDENTLLVTYRTWRGEKRGKHKAGASWEGRGDCVDCFSCVAVCPTGIDIRDGQQLECIGCGLCIDACDAVMDKVGRPRGLIAFDTIAHDAASAAGASPASYRWVRPRTVIYGAMLVAVAGLMLLGLATRGDVELTVLRDRAPLFVTLTDGAIRNAYTVKVLNKARAERRFDLALDGLPRAALQLAGAEGAAPSSSVALAARPDTVATFRVLVTLPSGVAAPESTPVAFALAERGRPATRHDSVFLAPGR